MEGADSKEPIKNWVTGQMRWSTNGGFSFSVERKSEARAIRLEKTHRYARRIRIKPRHPGFGLGVGTSTLKNRTEETTLGLKKKWLPSILFACGRGEHAKKKKKIPVCRD